MCTLISTYISTGVDSDARVQKQSQPHLARPTSIADICPLNTGAYTTVVVYLKTNSQRLVVLFSLLVIAVCFLIHNGWLCVCVFFPFILDIKFVGLPAGVTQEEGHTLLHTLKCCCTLLENRVDVSFIAGPRSVNTSLYNNSTSNKSAFSAILPSRSPR